MKLTATMISKSGARIDDLHVYASGRRWMTRTEIAELRRVARKHGHKLRARLAPATAPNPFSNATFEHYAADVPVFVSERPIVAFELGDLLVEGTRA